MRRSPNNSAFFTMRAINWAVGRYMKIGVHDTSNQTLGSADAKMGLLLGDTTGNRLVNSSDISQTQAQSGQPVDNHQLPRRRDREWHDQQFRCFGCARAIRHRGSTCGFASAALFRESHSGDIRWRFKQKENAQEFERRSKSLG
jgi:hypothetical protein